MIRLSCTKHRGERENAIKSSHLYVYVSVYAFVVYKYDEFHLAIYPIFITIFCFVILRHGKKLHPDEITYSERLFGSKKRQKVTCGNIIILCIS